MSTRGERHPSPVPGQAVALFEALDRDDVSAVRELLAQGADSGAIDPRVPALVASPALSYAASGGKSEIVGLLLERGAAVDARDSGGGTALIWACNAGHLDCARLPLQAGPGSSRWKAVVVQFVADALEATTASFKGYLDIEAGKLPPVLLTTGIRSGGGGGAAMRTVRCRLRPGVRSRLRHRRSR